MFEIIQQTTANTTNYMIGGYAVFFIVMGFYLASMVLRKRSLTQDLEALKDINEAEEK